MIINSHCPWICSPGVHKLPFLCLTINTNVIICFWELDVTAYKKKFCHLFGCYIPESMSETRSDYVNIKIYMKKINNFLIN